jgi:REP element-mobilizing transposase RayT
MPEIRSRQYPRRLRRLSEVHAMRNGHALFFVTLCTAGRRRLLANDEVHDRFRMYSAASPEKCSVWVGQYVILPDHLHVFVSAAGSANVSHWVGSLKRYLASCFLSGCEKAPFWQEGFFDHVLRGSESYAEKWAYVRLNPVRAGLVKTPEVWPFQGMMHALEW